MERYVLLVLGTVVTVILFIQMIRGVQYVELPDYVDDDDFFLFPVYSVGFAWSSISLFQLKGKLYGKLRREAELLYEKKDATQLANVYWAAALTFVHLVLAFGLLLSALLFFAAHLILLCTLGGAIFAGGFWLKKMELMLTDRIHSCEADLAEVVSTMAILLNSGMTLKNVWNTVSTSNTTEIYQLMQQSTEEMESGTTEIDAIYHFGMRSNSVEVKKFTSAMLQSMEKSGQELVFFMENQSSELWDAKRQKMLQEGEKAATKLLLPILLIFFGVLIIVMTAAFAGMLF